MISDVQRKIEAEVDDDDEEEQQQQHLFSNAKKEEEQQQPLFSDGAWDWKSLGISHRVNSIFNNILGIAECYHRSTGLHAALFRISHVRARCCVLYIFDSGAPCRTWLWCSTSNGPHQSLYGCRSSHLRVHFFGQLVLAVCELLNAPFVQVPEASSNDASLGPDAETPLQSSGVRCCGLAMYECVYADGGRPALVTAAHSNIHQFKLWVPSLADCNLQR